MMQLRLPIELDKKLAAALLDEAAAVLDNEGFVEFDLREAGKLSEYEAEQVEAALANAATEGPLKCEAPTLMRCLAESFRDQANPDMLRQLRTDAYVATASRKQADRLLDMIQRIQGEGFLALEVSPGQFYAGALTQGEVPIVDSTPRGIDREEGEAILAKVLPKNPQARLVRVRPTYLVTDVLGVPEPARCIDPL